MTTQYCLKERTTTESSSSELEIDMAEMMFLDIATQTQEQINKLTPSSPILVLNSETGKLQLWLNEQIGWKNIAFESE